MCSRHDAVQLEPPEGGSAAQATPGGLYNLWGILVGGHTPVPIDKNDSDLPPFLVLLPCRRRKLWRLGAQIVASSCADLPTFLLYLRQTHPCHSDCSRHSGARLRPLPRFRCWKQSV